MKVLVVAPQPFFTPRGTPFSVYHRARVAARLGATIDLLTYGEGEDVDLPGVRTIRIPRLPFLGPVKVGPSLGKLARDLLMSIWTVVLLARHRHDVVHAHEEAVFWCQFLKPLFRFQLVYDMHSSLPQQLLNFEYTESKLAIGLFRWFEDHALRRSDAVITISPALAEYARESMPEPDRHLLIENSLFGDIAILSDSAASLGQARALVERLLPGGRRLVLYAGTFEPYQGIELLLRSFAIARDRVADPFLLLVGGTKEQIRRYDGVARELALDDRHVVLEGRVPPRVARELVSKAAVVTSPRLMGSNTPLKIYELLASGVPLVATAIPAHTQVLDESVCFLAEPRPDAFAAGLVSALEDPARREDVVSAARSLYERRYSPSAYEAKMRRLFELLGAGVAPAEPVERSRETVRGALR